MNYDHTLERKPLPLRRVPNIIEVTGAPHPLDEEGGSVYTITFENGCSVSVVMFAKDHGDGLPMAQSYGGEKGLWEAIEVDENDRLISDSLQGWLTDDQLRQYLTKVARRR